MAEHHDNYDAPTIEDEQAAPFAFTLQVVSPSVGVSIPLSFPHLPATTSVKELKAKIRDILPSKPSDENQRLIHRGRMLGNETDTMIDVFGRETLESSQIQTLHLVLRPTAVDGPSTQPATPTPGMPPFSGLPSLPQPRPLSTPAIPAPPTLLGPAAPSSQFSTLHAHHPPPTQVDNLLNQLQQRVQGLHREAMHLQQEMAVIEQRYRGVTSAHRPNGSIPIPRAGQPAIPMPPSVQALIAQQQRERAAHGRQGIQDTNNFPPFGFPTNSGRSSPAPGGHTATYVQQGVTPNGDTWRTTMTVNETRTTVTLPNGPPGVAHGGTTDAGHYNPVPELMAHMHAHARPTSRPPSRVASRGPGNMERSASGASFGHPPVVAPNPASINHTPIPTQPFFAHAQPGIRVPTPQALTPFPSSTPTQPTVYILSSPSGPRALLVTGQDNALSRAYNPDQTQQVVHRPEIALPEFRNRLPRPGRRQAAEEQPAPPPLLGAHANPQAGAVAAGLPRMLWLLVRLIGIVWFISSSNQSWTRWALTISMAALIFIFNTGILNGPINDMWAPIRRHVENIIPLAGPDAALIPAANAAPIRQVGAAPPAPTEPLRTGPNGELDPQQVAARIIAQRRQQESWIRGQFRRIEHSLLLFLASLVPGVGERHIAAREAESTERQRQIDAAAAAAAAAEAASNQDSQENNTTEEPTIESEAQAMGTQEETHERGAPVAAN